MAKGLNENFAFHSEWYGQVLSKFEKAMVNR